MDHAPQLQQPLTRTVFHLKNRLDIIPFRGEGGEPNFPPEYLAQVFRRIVREETVSKVFYDGSVRNTTDFIDFIASEDNEVSFVEHAGKEGGFFWLNRFRQKSAFITYCFYREFWGRGALKISKSCIKFIFGQKNEYGEHLVEVLLGLTPANNKLAITFLLKNGMTVLGRVPGFLYDAHEGTVVDGIFSYKKRTSKPTFRIPPFFLVS